MKKLADLTLPGGQTIANPLVNPKSTVHDFTLGGITSSILELVFVLTGILMFIWALVGIFQYITAGGNKEGLAKARARITWAIVGFIIVMLAFSISLYAKDFLIKPKTVEFCTADELINCQTQSPPKTCVVVNGQPDCQ